MAILTAKTPDGLFKQIKPDAFALRGSRVNAPKDKLPEEGLAPLYHGDRVTYTKLYNGMPSEAQKAANEQGKVYGTHNTQKYYPRWNSPRKINPLPKSNSGTYGQVRLPEQWQYKKGSDLANAMYYANNLDLDDERSNGSFPELDGTNESRDALIDAVNKDKLIKSVFKR